MLALQIFLVYMCRIRTHTKPRIIRARATLQIVDDVCGIEPPNHTRRRFLSKNPARNIHVTTTTPPCYLYSTRDRRVRSPATLSVY